MKNSSVGKKAAVVVASIATLVALNYATLKMAKAAEIPYTQVGTNLAVQGNVENAYTFLKFMYTGPQDSGLMIDYLKLMGLPDGSLTSLDLSDWIYSQPDSNTFSLTAVDPSARIGYGGQEMNITWDYDAAIPGFGSLPINSSISMISRQSAYGIESQGNIPYVSVAPEPVSSILFLSGGVVIAGKRFLRKKKKV